MSLPELEKRIEIVKRDMIDAARRTDFIEAARLRDELVQMQDMLESQNQKEAAHVGHEA